MKLIKLKDYNRIYSVDSLQEEYRKLFGNSRTEYEKCRNKLRTNLHILDRSNIGSVLSYQQFEKLEGEDLYSIRHVGESNPRVIFAYIGEQGYIVLLSSCKEKSKNDYQPAIRRARERLKELEGLK